MCDEGSQRLKRRDLSGVPVDCFSKPVCSVCNSETSCYWIDNGCTDLDSDIFLSEYYDESQAEDNCAEYSTSTIDLSKVLGETIELKHNTVKDIRNVMCQWTIKTDKSKSIEITISRNDQTYEEIGLNYTLRGTLTSVDNKDLTSCGESTYSLKFDNNISEIVVRTRTRRNRNDYDILIAQEGKDLGTPNVLTNNKKLVEIIAVIVIAIFVIIIVVLVIFALCKRTTTEESKRGNFDLKLSSNKGKKKVFKYSNKLAEEKETYNEETMDCMLSGKYENMPRIYQTSKCLICLSKFCPEDMCHLTNECGHLFHSHCLKRWYKMVSHLSDLVCPKCQTPTNPTLDQYPENNDPSSNKGLENFNSRSQFEADDEEH
ncbi:unnamed protein product [Moneuplotes crassus]|uniref:RING-type domain-containing protein n=1 Tax=Euplotes crassus TaxID=5936 RepID=A0AAD1Y1N9_EUPCR|nr:unnamed protein product [Moneuplotes crassus]